MEHTEAERPPRVKAEPGLDAAAAELPAAPFQLLHSGGDRRQSAPRHRSPDGGRASGAGDVKPPLTLSEVYIKEEPSSCVKVESGVNMMVKVERMSPSEDEEREGWECAAAQLVSASYGGGKREPAAAGATPLTCEKTKRTAAGRHECALCGDEFKSAMGLKIHHTKVHPGGGGDAGGGAPGKAAAGEDESAARGRAVLVDGVKRLQCAHCDKSFPSRKRLRDHATCAHPAPHRAAACHLCAKTFKTKINLKIHVRLVHAPPQPAPCPQCHKTFKSWMLLQKHTAWSHPTDGRLYPCPLCPRTLRSLLGYAKHVQRVHPPAGAVTRCPEPACRKVFKSAFHLRQHNRRFHLKCTRSAPAAPAEPGAAPAPEPLDARRQWAAAQRHPCALCWRSFASPGALEWHRSLEHPDGAASNLCSICGKALPDKASLQRHVRMVHAPTPEPDSPDAPSCSECHKLFKSAASLRQHERVTHAPPEAAATCPQCGKVLKCRAHLLVHTRAVHGETGSHACRECGKLFTRPKYLERHERSHAAKTHSCPAPDCRKLFKSEEDVRRHERRVHAARPAEPPARHRCGACDKELSTVYTLRAHMSGVHAAPCLPCPRPECRVGFPSPQALAEHQHTHLRLVKLEPPEPERDASGIVPPHAHGHHYNGLAPDQPRVKLEPPEPEPLAWGGAAEG